MGYGAENRMKGLITAAGRGSRHAGLSEKTNKVLLDLGGTSLLHNILDQYSQSGIDECYVVVGFQAPLVRNHCGGRSTCILNPFYVHSSILSSIWLAQPYLMGQPFVLTPGDHYFEFERLQRLLQEQPFADVLVDVHLKACHDEDMKVYVTGSGHLHTMTKRHFDEAILGEFTSLVRFSALGSRQFFEFLEKYVWQHGIQGYLADVLCAYDRKHSLDFHLSDDHRRVDVDFPCDLTKARQLYQRTMLAAVA